MRARRYVGPLPRRWSLRVRAAELRRAALHPCPHTWREGDEPCGRMIPLRDAVCWAHQRYGRGPTFGGAR